jgi:hypothetical protein
MYQVIKVKAGQLEATVNDKATAGLEVVSVAPAELTKEKGAENIRVDVYVVVLRKVQG